MNKNLSQSNDALQSTQEPLETIENLILNIRGKQVMLDRDLARLYEVETKVLNQAVKRNIERFPADFMFQLTKEEFENWKSQIVTSNWMSQNATSNSILKGARKCPYAFTENGIAMLSGLLNSSIAIHVNIQIMRAFVAMRHTILDKTQLFSRIENIEHHQLLMIERQDKTESQIETIFQALSKYEIPKQYIFFNGQLFDAHILMGRLVELAEKRIVLIDNYIDESVLTLLLKSKKHVPATVYTMQMSSTFKLDLQKHNAQYPPIAVNIYTKAHDRFLIIDDKVIMLVPRSKTLAKSCVPCRCSLALMPTK